ncbi:phage tail tape measure protein [Viridibacillus arvi]|uniref:phage tail tape measure protein n=1 Tax=Viridibacillus arvi TaxID=263475 RepID=UPI003D2B136A
MADAEVGNLRVSLSMNSATFERSLASIDRSIKTLGQEMSIVRNRGREWGTTTDGLRTKQETLTRLLSSQEAKVRNLRAAYERSKRETSENSVATEELAARLNRAVAEYTRTETEINDVTAAIRRQEEELRRSQSSWQRASESMQRVGESMQKVGDKMKAVGQSMSLYVTAPIVALGVGAAKAAIEFESAFAGVRKTVDTSEEGFKKLETGIRDMAKTLPTSASEIAAVAESAGQLGIAEENILSFTRTIVDLGESTNMTREQAATEFAKFANITGMAQKDFDRLGSSVVAMGNNFATTESDISSMAMRLAGAGTQVGMSEADIIGLATALSSVGIEAEMGGSAISRVMVSMQVATSTGFTKVQDLSKQTGYSLRDLQMMVSHSGKAFGNLAEDLGMTKKELTTLVNAGVDLEGFSKVAGMTGEEFKKAFEKDAIGAIGAFINGLGNAEEKGDTAINMLQEMGINSVLLRDSLLRAGGASELFGDAVKLSNEAWEENTALTKEAEQRYKTTESQLKMLKNKFTEIGISMKNVLIPPLLKLAEALGPIAENFSNLSDRVKTIIVVIAGIASAIGPALVVIGMLIKAVGTITTALAPVATAIGEAGGLMEVLGTAMTSIVSPIGIAVLAIGSIAAAIVGLYKNHEGFRTMVQTTWSTIKTTITNAMDGIVSFVQSMGEQLSTFWSENQEGIKEAASNVWAAISTVIDVALKVISGVMSVVWPIIKALVVSTWEAIKDVIEGVTKVITGIIKTFSSLITGDWKGVWEGIKQILSGALEAVWGAITLYFVGKLLGPLKSFGPAAKSIVTAAWNGIKGIITGVLNGLKGSITASFNLYKTSISTILNATKTVVSSIWNGIKTVVTTVMGGIRNTVTTSWNGVKTITSTVLNGVKVIISSIFNTFKTIVRKSMEGVATAVDVGWERAATILRNIDLVQVGKDVIAGFILGINQKVKDIVSAAKGIGQAFLGAMDKALDRHSPSKETEKRGKDTGQGFVNGIAKKEKDIAAAGRKAASAALKSFNQKMQKLDLKLSAGKINLKQYVSSLESMKTQYSGVANAIEKIDAKIAKTRESSSKKQLAALTKTFNNEMSKLSLNFKAKKIDTSEYIKSLESMKNSYKGVANANAKIDAQIATLRKNNIKEMFKDDKADYAAKKKDKEVSLTDELDYLKTVTKHYKKNTEERTYFENLAKQKKQEITAAKKKIDDDYLKNVQDLNQKLIDGENKLKEEYKKAVDDKAKSLYSFAGLFDEIAEKAEISGQQLIANLQGQVDTFKNWSANIASLASKGIDEGLLAELQAMGPQAGAEIAALNTLSDEQLTQYTALWKEKSELARNQAVGELEGMRIDTERQINELQRKTVDQLRIYQSEWQSSMKKVKGDVKNEMKEMPDIGKYAVTGLINGMLSQQGALQSASQSLADIVSNTFKSALDIHSPSRVFKGFGININEGLILGINQSTAKLKRALASTYNGMATSAQNMMGMTTTNNNNHSTTENRTINNTYNMTYQSPKPLDPYEASRMTRNSMKELGLQF